MVLRCNFDCSFCVCEMSECGDDRCMLLSAKNESCCTSEEKEMESRCGVGSLKREAVGRSREHGTDRELIPTATNHRSSPQAPLTVPADGLQPVCFGLSHRVRQHRSLVLGASFRLPVADYDAKRGPSGRPVTSLMQAHAGFTTRGSWLIGAFPPCNSPESDGCD